MSDLIPVPTLSTSGWVKSGAEKANFLFAHFYLANASQSYLYSGQISSLPALVQQNQHNMAAFCSALQNQLETYLKRYYPEGVQAKVTSDDVTANNLSDLVTVTLQITVVESGVVKSFGALVNTQGGKLLNIVSLNNTGVGTS